MNQSKKLRSLLKSGETFVMPDAYDPITARIIERLGFPAVQCSGYSFSLAACCPTEAEFGFRENLDLTRKIVDAVNVPVMADGEDGFGDADAVRQTVREFARIGAAGINIEDQILGQHEGVRVIDCVAMVEKIVAAKEAAAAESNPDLIVNARTDALRAGDERSHGLKMAIDRANRYLEAGADMAFICYAATLDEVRILAQEVHGPISIAAGQPYNIQEFSLGDLKRCGVARVSLPTLAIFSAIRAVMESLRHVRDPDGLSAIVKDDLLCSPEDMSELFTSSH